MRIFGCHSCTERKEDNDGCHSGTLYGIITRIQSKGIIPYKHPNLESHNKCG